MTKIVSEDQEGQISEPEYGFWSLKKEIALMYWIWPFLQIASQHFDSFYYIDLFAGSGLMKAESELFVGSPLVAVCSTLPDKKFSQYIFLEKDKTRKEVLEKRAALAAANIGICCPKVFNADCNLELENILKENCPTGKTCYLAFVDPEGFSDLKWTTLRKLLKHGKGDILLNFPTSGIIRNFYLPQSQPALTDFFGDDEWQKIDPTSDNLVNHFMSKIANVDGYKRAVDNLPVLDESNHRLYDLIFATGSSGMKNVTLDLKNKLEKIKTKNFREITEVMVGPQKQLISY